MYHGTEFAFSIRSISGFVSANSNYTLSLAHSNATNVKINLLSQYLFDVNILCVSCKTKSDELVGRIMLSH